MFERIFTIVILLIILGTLLSATGLYFIQYSNEETIEIVVKDKYIKRKSNDDIYMVVSEDDETYKIMDMIFIGKFNSTDLYNQLEIGKRYKITTTGIRNNFLSEYKNINKIEEMEETNEK